MIRFFRTVESGGLKQRPFEYRDDPHGTMKLDGRGWAYTPGHHEIPEDCQIDDDTCIQPHVCGQGGGATVGG